MIYYECGIGEWVVTCKILDVRLLLVLGHLHFRNVDTTIFLQECLPIQDPNKQDDMLSGKYHIKLSLHLVDRPHNNLGDQFAKVLTLNVSHFCHLTSTIKC